MTLTRGPAAGRQGPPAVLAGIGEGQSEAVHRALMGLGVAVVQEHPSIEALLKANEARPGSVPKGIVLTSPSTAGDFDWLRRAVQGLPESSFLALVDSSEPMLVLKAMRTGAAQVVPLPLVGEEFAEAVLGLAYESMAEAPPREVITVAGATGGAGASTLAVNLAYELAEAHGKRVVLVDLALKMGALADLLDVVPEVSILDLAQDVERIDRTLVEKALVPVTERLRLLAGPQAALGPRQVPIERLFPVLDLVTTLAEIVVIDLPASFDDLFFETLLSSQHVVLVAQQKIPAIRAIKLITDSLEREKADCRVHLVINRYNKKIPGFSADDVQRLLRSDRVLTIAEDAPSVIHATNRGAPLRKAAPGSPVLADLAPLIHQLYVVGPLRSVAPATLLGRWFKGAR